MQVLQLYYNSLLQATSYKLIVPLFACLRKVHAMASDEEQLKISALAKLREFERLAYPVGIRKFACAVLARDTECTMWWRVRAAQM